MTDYERTVIELLTAILKGIQTQYFNHPYTEEAKAFNKYAESTIKMAEELYK